MKPIIYLFFVASISFVSCETTDFDSKCNVMDPAKELSWLKDRIGSHTDFIGAGSSYHSFSFEDETYIVQGYCGKGLILIVSTYFDCKGKEKTFSTAELDRINSLETSLIWRGSDCN